MSSPDSTTETEVQMNPNNIQIANSHEELVQIATENRDNLLKKHGVDKDSPEYAESEKIVSEELFRALQYLKSANTPETFGQVIDQKVVQSLKSRFSSNPELGDTAAKIFIERTATKARDEILFWLKQTNPNIKITDDVAAIFNNFTSVESCAQVGGVITEVLQQDSLFSHLPEVVRDNLFKLGREAKITEFENFYNTSHQTAKLSEKPREQN